LENCIGALCLCLVTVLFLHVGECRCCLGSGFGSCLSSDIDIVPLSTMEMHLYSPSSRRRVERLGIHARSPGCLSRWRSANTEASYKSEKERLCYGRHELHCICPGARLRFFFRLRVEPNSQLISTSIDVETIQNVQDAKRKRGACSASPISRL